MSPACCDPPLADCCGPSVLLPLQCAAGAVEAVSLVAAAGCGAGLDFAEEVAAARVGPGGVAVVAMPAVPAASSPAASASGCVASVIVPVAAIAEQSSFDLPPPFGHSTSEAVVWPHHWNSSHAGAFLGSHWSEADVQAFLHSS